MASQAILAADVRGWLDRSDIDTLMPSWIRMVETEIDEKLRARVMIKRATQPIDGNFLVLPSDWLHWESIKDYATGFDLKLEDNWTGPPMNSNGPAAATAFRIVGDCIEFLPHPIVGGPDWVPQKVSVAYYARPETLLSSVSATNGVLERHYAVYLFGVCKYGALWSLDDDRATQASAMFDDAIGAANLWKMASDYSGAPLRSVVRGF